MLKSLKINFNRVLSPFINFQYIKIFKSLKNKNLSQRILYQQRYNKAGYFIFGTK